MLDNLDNIRTALAALTKAELQGLQAAAEGSPDIAVGLLADLVHICKWELRRRKRPAFDAEGAEGIDSTQRTRSDLRHASGAARSLSR